MRVVAVFCLVSLVQAKIFLVETNDDDTDDIGDIGDTAHTDDTKNTEDDTGDLSGGDYADIRWDDTEDEL